MQLSANFVFFLFAVLPVLTQGATTCSKVKIKGSYIYSQDSRIDEVYKKTDDTSNGKPVFSRQSGSTDDYIYWHNTRYTWYVGPIINSTVAGMYVRSNDSHPVDATSTWYAVVFSSFLPYSSIYVTCSNALESWQIALIVVAVLVAVGVTIGVVIYCVNKSGKPRRTVHPSTAGTTVFYNGGNRGPPRPNQMGMRPGAPAYMSQPGPRYGAPPPPRAPGPQPPPYYGHQQPMMGGPRPPGPAPYYAPPPGGPDPAMPPPPAYGAAVSQAPPMFSRPPAGSPPSGGPALPPSAPADPAYPPAT